MAMNKPVLPSRKRWSRDCDSVWRGFGHNLPSDLDLYLSTAAPPRRRSVASILQVVNDVFQASHYHATGTNPHIPPFLTLTPALPFKQLVFTSHPEYLTRCRDPAVLPVKEFLIKVVVTRSLAFLFLPGP